MLGLGLNNQFMAGRALSAWTPEDAFAQGERGVWYEMKVENLYQDDAGATPVVADGDPVRRGDDLSPNGIPFLAPSDLARPVWKDTEALRFDLSDDQITVDFGTPFAGTAYIKTPDGILRYEVSVASVWTLPSNAVLLHNNDLGPVLVMEGSVDEPGVAAYMGGDDRFAGVTAMSGWFMARSDVTAIHAGAWDTSSVTDFENFAASASSLVTLDVSGWDTSAATTLFRFAWNCTALTTLDVSGWDTSAVQNIRDFAVGCSSLTTLDVSNWNTSAVTTLSSFAAFCSALTALDVSNWDVAGVSSFLSFIRGTAITALDISNWDTSNVTSFSSFARDSALETLVLNGGTGNPLADSLCTNYGSAFTGTNLTQQSIDDILVAIESAGTSNGTFAQSGGSTPSVTGETAIDALRLRGWTVTVTGGY